MAVCSMQGSELELTANMTNVLRPAQFTWCNRYVCAAGCLLGLSAIAGLIWGLSCSGTAVPGSGPSFNTSDIIVGGENAEEGRWPFMVSVQEYNRHGCGGSLINGEWVLSAAHCYQYTSPEDMHVILGKRNLTGPNGVSRAVAEIVLHPAYDPWTNAYDMALLRLASPVPFTDGIRPVCLAANGSVFSHGTPSWVLGWGNIHEGVPLPLPKVLQQVQVPVVDNKVCNRSYPGLITDDMICAGLLLEGGKDSCQGDSGGPMVSKYGSDWVQSGVVSWGYGCARPSLPGVYARADRCEEWIESVVKKTDLCFIRFESTPAPDAESSSNRPGLTAAAVGSVPEDQADLDLEFSVEE